MTGTYEKVRGMKYIHVNQHRIRDNLKNNTNYPVLTVKHKRKNLYGHAIEIDGPSKLIYSGKFKLLSCGARVAIATTSPIKVATDPEHSKWVAIK